MKTERRDVSKMIPRDVCGIPAFIEIESFYSGKPAKLYPIDKAYPEEPAEMEIEIYDRKGYRAKWLERKAEAARTPNGNSVLEEIKIDFITKEMEKKRENEEMRLEMFYDFLKDEKWLIEGEKC